jgi:xylose dehydrogenase (NAD/NADP)
VRIGVLGAANIARKVVIPSIVRANGVELAAIASESTRAADFLEQTELRTIDGRPLRETVRACTYEELLTDNSVEAVYIPLPNHLHAHWSKRAADAGKHVLCEKPAARTRAEAADAIEHCVARGVVWMEAFMYRFHPQWQVVFEHLRAGSIGKLRLVRSVFTFTVTNPENVRRQPDLGGGSLYDVGYYCVNASRWAMGAEPVAVSGSMSLGPEGVDDEFAGVLEFGDGRLAQIASSFTQPYRHEVELLGTAGRIRVPDAFVNGSEPVTIELENPAGEWQRIEVEGDDEYRLEIEDFAACVASGRQPQVVSHDDTLANMAAIDALYEAARTGRRIEL